MPLISWSLFYWQSHPSFLAAEVTNAEFEVPFVVRRDFDFHLAEDFPTAKKSWKQGCFNTPFGTHTLEPGNQQATKGMPFIIG